MDKYAEIFLDTPSSIAGRFDFLRGEGESELSMKCTWNNIIEQIKLKRKKIQRKKNRPSRGIINGI